MKEYTVVVTRTVKVMVNDSVEPADHKEVVESLVMLCTGSAIDTDNGGAMPVDRPVAITIINEATL